MATPSQISANQLNSQSSTGPKTEAGKAASALNNFRHGLVPGAAFKVLPTEDQSQFDQLLAALRSEHNPVAPTEAILVEGMAQAHWLRARATALEASCFDPQTGQVTNEKQLALYLRYQNTYRRAFHKCLNDLLKLRKEIQKLKIGFEQHRRKEEEHSWHRDLHPVNLDLRMMRVEERAERTERNQAEIDRANAFRARVKAEVLAHREKNPIGAQIPCGN
jgi:hypothetical protein